jgi:hypothetical protein
VPPDQKLPRWAVGSTESISQPMWVFDADSKRIVLKPISYVSCPLDPSPSHSSGAGSNTRGGRGVMAGAGPVQDLRRDHRERLGQQAARPHHGHHPRHGRPGEHPQARHGRLGGSRSHTHNP